MSTLRQNEPATTEVDRKLCFDLDGRQPGPEKHPDTSTTSLNYIGFGILCMYHSTDTTYIPASTEYEF